MRLWICIYGMRLWIKISSVKLLSDSFASFPINDICINIYDFIMEGGQLLECTLNTDSKIILDEIPPQVPELLYKIFIALDGDYFKEIISWLEDDRSFVIHNRVSFTDIVCPYSGLSDRMVFNQEMKQYDYGIMVD